MKPAFQRRGKSKGSIISKRRLQVGTRFLLQSDLPMSPGRKRQLHKSQQIYQETEMQGILSDNTDHIAKLAIKADSIRRKEEYKKEFKYILDIQIDELSAHPRFHHPKVKRFRSVVRKQMMMRFYLEQSKAYMLKANIHVLRGYAKKKRDNIVNPIPLQGISFDNMIWYFWDPFIALVFIYEMLMFSFM